MEENTTKERVAYQLAKRVLYEDCDSERQKRNTDFRKYYLDLYAECLEASNNSRALDYRV